MSKSTDYKALIPKPHFCKDNGLFWEEQYVGNFGLKIESRIKSITDGELEEFVRLRCTFAGGGESDDLDIQISQLETIKWSTHDMRCKLNPDCSKATKYLASMIQAALAALMDADVVTEYTISRLGMHFVEGHPIYNKGDCLVRSPKINDKVIIKHEPSPKKLVVDERCSERQAAVGMMKVINLSPIAGMVIFLHCLLGIMRMLYAEVDKVPRFILFLVGYTGTKKTTLAAFITQMYDRDTGIESPRRLDSTSAAFEQILHDAYDCVTVMDDMFPAQSSEIKRKQEKTLIDLTRIVGDDSGRAVKKGDGVVSKEANCNVMVTGEYLIGTGSDAARLLPIAFTTPVDNAELTQCQSQPLIVSTFYNFFIEWFVQNYHEIKQWLVKWLGESRATHLGVHDRLQETHFFLSSTHRIFLMYCVDKGFATPETAKHQHLQLRQILTYFVRKQDERVRMSSDVKTQKPSYLSIICNLYDSKVLRLTDDIANLKDKHHGLIYEDCLCLRSVKLMPEIIKLIPNANLNDVIDSLTAQGAIKPGNDKTSIQISGGGGKRFLAIPLKKLK